MFEDGSEVVESAEIFGGAEDDLEHRVDERDEIGLAAVDRLVGKGADGFQASLDGLQAKFFGEFGFGYCFQA